MSNTPAAAEPVSPHPSASFSTAALTSGLLERSPLLIYAIDLQGRLLLANRRFQETTGWSEAECADVDTMLTHLYPNPEYREVVQRLHLNRATSSPLDEIELSLRTRDGGEALVAWSTARISDHTGQPIGCAFIGSDQTSTRNLRHLLLLLRSTIDVLSEGVLIAEPSGRIFTWNASAMEFLGRGDKAIEGLPLHELISGLPDELNSALEDPAGYTGIHTAKGSDEASFEVRVRTLKTEAGLAAGILCIIQAPNPGPELAARIEGLQSQLMQLNEEIAARTREAGEKDRFLNELRYELNQLDEQSSAKDQDLARLHSEIEQKDQETSAKESTIAELRAELRQKESAAEEAVKELRSEMERGIAGHNEALEASKRREEELTRELDELNSGHAQREQQIEELSGRVADAEKALELSEQRAIEANHRAAGGEDTLRIEREQSAGHQAEAARLQEELKAAGERAEAMAAELSGQEKELERLSAELVTSQQSLDAAEQGWDLERIDTEQRHRENLEELANKLNSERKALEEQISRDILAAEERAANHQEEADASHRRDREEWQAALAAARAEGEASRRAELDELRAELARTSHQASEGLTVQKVAVTAADMNGVIMGWSDGASALDGRDQKAAVGQRIHEDVLRLDGVDWKTLVGKIIISGHLEQNFVLINEAGERVPVLLIADLMRGPGGAPTGLTEFILPISPRQSDTDITDVSDIMELMEEDDSGAMSLRNEDAPKAGPAELSPTNSEPSESPAK